MIDTKKEELYYDASVTTNSNGSPILGRLEGPCADIINATRNGRKYSAELWEKVFKDPIVNEYFECGGIFGELGHPMDGREEIDMEKIALCLPEPPKKNSKGELVGHWDILNTPNGRILKCLCDYGYKMGISSRGSGETYTEYDGTESVDPSTYSFSCFDAVLLPAVKSARLNLVTESLNNKKSFTKAITEALNKSSEEDRKVMQETLNNLNIDYNPKQDFNIDATISNTTADNDGVSIVKDLQESLKKNIELEKTIEDLQEKLSVCYAKEKFNEEKISSYKASISSLTEKVKSLDSLNSKVSALSESLQRETERTKSQEKSIKDLKESYSDNKKSLVESLRIKDDEINRLRTNLHEANKKLTEIKTYSSLVESELKRDVADLKTDSAIKHKEFQNKLESTEKLVEKYRRIADKAVNKYIDSQAKILGVTSNEIKSKLNENYSFNDIDSVCESLQEYKLNMSKLPFSTFGNPNVKMTITESKDTILGNKFESDEVDSQLRALANL